MPSIQQTTINSTNGLISETTLEYVNIYKLWTEINTMLCCFDLKLGGNHTVSIW